MQCLLINISLSQFLLVHDAFGERDRIHKSQVWYQPYNVLSVMEKLKLLMNPAVGRLPWHNGTYVAYLPSLAVTVTGLLVVEAPLKAYLSCARMIMQLHVNVKQLLIN